MEKKKLLKSEFKIKRYSKPELNLNLNEIPSKKQKQQVKVKTVDYVKPRSAKNTLF